MKNNENADGIPSIELILREKENNDENFAKIVSAIKASKKVYACQNSYNFICCYIYSLLCRYLNLVFFSSRGKRLEFF